MVEQLERVLNAIEKEIKSENSIWDKEQLISVVKPEMEELYTHFKKGKMIGVNSNQLIQYQLFRYIHYFKGE